MRRKLVAIAALGCLGWLLSRAVPPAGEAQAASVVRAAPDDTVRDESRAADPTARQVRLAADIQRAAEAERLRAAADRATALGQSQAELRQAVRRAPAAVGSLSIGRANRGALFNAVQMPESRLWHLAEPDKAWGTEETVRGLAHAIGRVAETFVDSPELWIGHISARGGGWLRPHRSHQTGRDADVGFYYADGSEWYERGTAKNLDIPRNWVLIESLLRETDVELIFLDRSIQALLVDYALGIGEDAAWLDTAFEGQRRRSQCTIRHEWGHATHMHVRFQSRVSRELAERVHPILVEERLVPKKRYYR